MREITTRQCTDTESSGLSSNETQQSSIRYEPVTDRSVSPSSPSDLRRPLFGSAQLLNHNMKKIKRTPPHRLSPPHDSRCDEISDSNNDGDDEMAIDEIDDVMALTESRPVNCNKQRRMSSPVIEYGARRGSLVPKTSSGNLFVPKKGHSASTSEAPRIHGAMPRMGTGIHPTSPGSSSVVTANNNGVYKMQSSHPSLATRLTSQEDGYDPVITTTLKPTHEVDETNMWNYRGNTEPRPTFPYNGNTSNQTHIAAAADPNGEDTASRFMSKRPSIMAAYNTRHIRDSHQYDTKSIKTKVGSFCNWKCSAILFIVLSAVLFALAAYFMVQSIQHESTAASTECLISTEEDQVEIVVKERESPPQTQEAPDNEFLLGHKTTNNIPPGAFWRSHVVVLEDQHAKFNFSIHKRAIIGVYGRRGISPTHTKFDFFEALDGNDVSISLQSSRRNRRAIAGDSFVSVSFVQYLYAGTWHFGVFNDGDSDENVEFVGKMSDGLSTCPNNCNNNGDCSKGVCKCFLGFQGRDCSQVSCPIVCNGQGLYAHGACVCFSGWKGVDCSTSSNKCEVADCSGHGTCNDNGECVCNAGFKGNDCSFVDCMDPSCTGHGVCHEGTCRCDIGWGGEHCSEELSPGCFHPCNNQGTLDPVTNKCFCNSGWSGSNCATARTSPSIALCVPNCNPEHGVCSNGKCKCHAGWTGDACNQKMCDDRCYAHGSCNNGICQCEMGWNGELCTINGCPNDCSSHGHCALKSGKWSCNCLTGWKGDKCNIESETQCGDGRDNDRDTLIDCKDPDCCSQSSCMWGSLCQGSKDPVKLVNQLRARNPIPNTSTFFERVQFFIALRNGLQSDITRTIFEEKKVSMVRGLIQTQDGSRIIGARVVIFLRTEFGNTKTDREGWFNILINGGGGFLIQVSHASFETKTMPVFVPCNEYVISDPIIMKTPSQSAVLSPQQDCDISKYQFPDVAILPFLNAFSQGQCKERGNIIPETQAVRESVNLPFSETSLDYVSSRVKGYESTIEIQLTTGDVPGNLKNMHMIITIQGVQFQKIFEPVPHLRYTFIWDRMDVFGQKVYGTVNAKIEVGAEYQSCSKGIWETYYSTVHGYDPAVEFSLGGWTINIHHTYFPQTSTIYLGNGGQMKINKQPPVISTYMGTGNQRRKYCDQCNGPAIEKSLLAPVALASDAKGNVYVADYNYIRKIDTERNVTSLLYLIKPPHRYYIAASPREDGTLYYSDPNDRHVYKIRNMYLRPRPGRDSVSQTDISGNKMLVAGIGSLCLPLAQDKCGEGKLARLARLSNPRGLTITHDNVIYLVDGAQIKFINSSNNIYTLAGSNNLASSRPLPCSGRISFDQVQFEYPTEIVYNALYDSLFVLDLNVIVQLHLQSRQASLTAGIPVHCLKYVSQKPDVWDSRKIMLISPNSITVSQKDGALYISETNEVSVHRVRRIDLSNHRISTIAGSESECDCQLSDCNCYVGDGDFAKNARLNTPVALTTTPDGALFIADQLNQRIRKVASVVPLSDENGQYKIANAATNELYLFASDGRHISTQNAITENVLYNFSRSSQGELSSITDIHGNRLAIIRNADDVPNKLLLPNRGLLHLQMSDENCLTKVTLEENSLPLLSVDHSSDGGLVQSITKGRTSTTFFSYDLFGRLKSSITADGRHVTLYKTVNASRHEVTMQTSTTAVGKDSSYVGTRSIVIETDPGFLSDIIKTTEGQMVTTYERWTDNSITVKYLDGSKIQLQTKPHDVLGLTSPYIAKRTIEIPDEPLENSIEWKLRKRNERYSSSKHIISKHMFVNGRNILTIDYSQKTQQSKIYDDHTKFVLRVSYDDKGQPYQWSSSSGDNTFSNLTYDRSGHATVWKRGTQTEQLLFDVSGRITKRQTSSEGTWVYSNNDQTTSLTPPGQTLGYKFAYDDYSDLRLLATPMGVTYTASTLRGVGFIRSKVALQNRGTWFVQDRDDRGNLLQHKYVGEDRIVVFRFDAQDHVSEILHDSTDDRNLWDPFSGELVSSATTDCVLRFEKNGPLIKQMVVTPQKGNFAQSRLDVNAVFLYEYDTNLRKKTLRAKLNETMLAEESFAYHDVSGKARLFAGYSAIHYSNNMYVISTKAFTFTKESDGSGKTTQIKCDIYRNPVAVVTIEYDQSGRISYQKFRVGSFNNETVYQYKYYAIGSLQEVTVNNRDRWRFTYDHDGKMVAMQHPGSRLIEKRKYDSVGRLVMRGGISYKYDKDGFLKQRGREIFEYDSLGHLVTAYKMDNTYKIVYGYDGLGRLSSRYDTFKKQLFRFYYADPVKQWLLTHMYNSTLGHSGEVTKYRYDLEGKLFAIEKNGNTLPITCDAVGTPIAVFDTSGFMLKAIRYTPFGEVIFDSAPVLQIMIAFKGGIMDPTTKFVHFANRKMIQNIEEISIISQLEKSEFGIFSGVDYDPTVGQVTTPDISIFQPQNNSPTTYRPYQIIDPVNPTRKRDHMTSVDDWLNELEFSLDNVAPKPKMAERQSNKASVQCQLSKQLESYLNLETEKKSALIPKLKKHEDHIPDIPMLAEGFVISIDQGVVTSHVVKSSTDDIKRLSGIITGAKVMLGGTTDSQTASMSLTDGGKPVIYLWKSSKFFSADKVKLRLSRSERTLSAGFQTSQNFESSPSGNLIASFLRVSTEGNLLKVESTDVVLAISYIENDAVATEKKKILDASFVDVENQAWAKEKQNAIEGRETRWEANEKDRLIAKGSLSWYEVLPSMNLEKYPEFVDSWRNVKFSRKRS